MAKLGGAKLDLRDSTTQVKLLATELEKLNSELQRITANEVKADASGRVYEARLEAMTTAGRKVVLQLRDMGNALDIQTKMLMKEAAPGQGLGSASMAKYRQAVEKIMDPGTGWQQHFRRQMEYAFGDIPENAARSQKNRVRAAMQGLMTGMLTKDWSDNMIQDVINTMRRNRDAIFLDPQKQAISRYVGAFAKAQEDSMRPIQQQQDRAIKRDIDMRARRSMDQDSGQMRAWLYGSEAFGKDYARMATKDPRAIVQIQGYMNRLQSMVSGGKTNVPELQGLFKQWQSGNLPNSMTSLQSKAVQAFSQIHLGLTRGTQLAVPFYERMQGIYHLFMAYIGIRWYSYITSGFRQATEAAVQFQQQIALTQTITQDVGASTEKWARTYANVAKKGSFAPTDVAKAGYDLLSNQVTKGTEDTALVLGKTQDFARTTGGDLTDAVDTLSSALNAFNVGIDQSDSFLSKFFVTIDRGRIRVDELQKTIGRLNTFSSNVGLNISESLGGVSLLTRKGIQPETAQTLLLNVYQKLLNPTEKMQKVLDDIGVSTGENLVKTYGWVGALEKLYSAAHGSASEIADMFGEIRGGQGALILMKNLSELREDIRLHQASGDTYKGAIDIVNNNPGQKLRDELNKLETYLTTDFKQGFLNAFINIDKTIGGTANAVTRLIGELKILVPLLSVAYGTYKIKGIASAFGELYSQQRAAAGFGGGAMSPLLGGKGSPTLSQGAMLGLKTVASIPAVQVAAFIALEEVIGHIAERSLNFLDRMRNVKEESAQVVEKFKEISLERVLKETAQERDTFNNALTQIDQKLRGIGVGAMSQINKQLGELKPKLDDLTKGLRDKFDVVLSEMRRVSEYWKSMETFSMQHANSLKSYEDNLQSENFEQRFRARLAQNDRNRQNMQSWKSGTDSERGFFARGSIEDAGIPQRRQYYYDFLTHIRDEMGKIEGDIQTAVKDVNAEALKNAWDNYDKAVHKYVSTLNEMSQDSYSVTRHVQTGYDELGRPTGNTYDERRSTFSDNWIERERYNAMSLLNSQRDRVMTNQKEISAIASQREVQARQATETVATMMESYIRTAIVDKQGGIKKEFLLQTGESPEANAQRITKAQESLVANLRQAIDSFMQSGNVPSDIQSRIKPAIDQALSEMNKTFREHIDMRQQQMLLEQQVESIKVMTQKIQEMVDIQRKTYEVLVARKIEASTSQAGALGAVVGGLKPLEQVTPRPNIIDEMTRKANWETIPNELGKMYGEIAKFAENGNVTAAYEKFQKFQQYMSAWGYMTSRGTSAQFTQMSDIERMLSTRKYKHPYAPTPATDYTAEQEAMGTDYVSKYIPGFDLKNIGSQLAKAALSKDNLNYQQNVMSNMNTLMDRANAHVEGIADQAGVLKKSDIKDVPNTIDTMSKAWEDMASKAPGAADGLNTFTAKMTEFASFMDKFSSMAQSSADNMKAAATALDGVASSIADAKIKMSAPSKTEDSSPSGHRLGGPVRYFAWGGPVGTDTVAAWLGRDEMVMNGRATKRWYSQLQAMNAGRLPDSTSKQSRPQGPAIGTLHINIQGGQTTQQTGTEIASALQRAINLGAVRWKGNT